MELKAQNNKYELTLLIQSYFCYENKVIIIQCKTEINKGLVYVTTILEMTLNTEANDDKAAIELLLPGIVLVSVFVKKNPVKHKNN